MKTETDLDMEFAKLDGDFNQIWSFLNFASTWSHDEKKIFWDAIKQLSIDLGNMHVRRKLYDFTTRNDV